MAGVPMTKCAACGRMVLWLLEMPPLSQLAFGRVQCPHCKTWLHVMLPSGSNHVSEDQGSKRKRRRREAA